RIPERCQDDGVDDDLCDALAHLEPLSAEKRVDQIGEDPERDREAEGVSSRHQTCSSTYRSRKMNAKHASAIASAAASYINPSCRWSSQGRAAGRPRHQRFHRPQAYKD